MFSNTYNDWDCMKRFCELSQNVIGPKAGSAFVPEQVLDDGTIVPAQDEKGNPLLYYACIRSTEPLSLPPDICACNEAEGILVLGIWS